MLTDERIDQIHPMVKDFLHWKRAFARAIEAEVLTEAQNPVAFPILPAGIVMHPQLGELYDRLQVQQYAMKYACLAAIAAYNKGDSTYVT